MTEFFWRIWTAVVLVTLAVLAVFVLLATLQFQGINSDLTSDRLAVLADRTAEPFHAPVRIGLPLSAVRNAAALLERARQSDRNILAVHVIDANGYVVHSTAAPPPDRISPQELLAIEKSANGRWQLSTRTTFVSGITIPDSSGGIAGGVVIHYPKTAHLTQVRSMAAELGFAALAGLLAVAIVGAALLPSSLGRLFGRFEHIENEIFAYEKDAWRSAAGLQNSGQMSETEPSSLRGLLTKAELSYRQIGQHLSDPGPTTRDEP